MKNLSNERRFFNIRLDRGDIASVLISSTKYEKNQTNPIGFDNSQLMSIYPEERRIKRASVDYAKTVSFPRLEGQSGILIESHSRSR